MITLILERLKKKKINKLKCFAVLNKVSEVIEDLVISDPLLCLVCWSIQSQPCGLEGSNVRICLVEECDA